MTQPEAQPMAFISDVHGNLTALEAVFNEFRAHDVAKVFVGGDLLLGGPAPLEVWRALQREKCRSVQGMSDKALAEVDAEGLEATGGDETKRLRVFRETQDTLGELVLQQLRRLPESIRLPLIDGSEVLLVHGSPADITVELSHDLNDDEMRLRLAGDPADIIVCGSTHVPFIRALDDQRIVNVGSVGETPDSSRVAHYAVVRPKMGGAEIFQSFVEY